MSSSDAFFVNLPIRQINGCRYFGPRDEVKAFNPPKGSEIFVARIPQDFPHKELLRIFFTAGQVYDVRLMLTFMKENKGYAFVRYFSPEMASKALKNINGYRFTNVGRQGHLVAMLSTDHRTLMLTGCSPDVTKEEVESVFRDVGGAELVSVSEEFQRGRASPVFYLLFASHRGAALMKKANWKDLIPEEWGAWVQLNWQPNNEVSQRRRFKLEKRNYLSSLETRSPTYLNWFQNSPANLGLPRSVLPAPNAEVQPLSELMPEKALLSNTGNSNSFAQIFNNHEEQKNRGRFLLSPGDFLQHRRGLDGAQGFSDYPLLNPLSENSQHRWNRENSTQDRESNSFEPEGAWGGSALLAPPQRGLPEKSQHHWNRENSSQDRESSSFESEGAWGGSALLAPPRHSVPGNSHDRWLFEDSPSSRQNSSFEQAAALGISSLMIQNDEHVTDENSQPQLPDPLSLPLFGRPIRGRGNTDQQAPKTMRF